MRYLEPSDESHTAGLVLPVRNPDGGLMNFVDGKEPKKGDRVRVTYESEWSMYYVPNTATVEVLAPPLYVNHNATEPQPGDVAQVQLGWVLMFDAKSSCWRDAEGMRWPLATKALTLLVRDGRPVL